MRVCRLTLPRYIDTAFSGEGVRRVGGRWTPAGQPVVHTSASVSLAVLEILVHTNVNSIPTQHVIAVDVPDTMPVDTVAPSELPDDWRRTPPPPALQNIGGAWLDAGRTVILRAPSAIVPLEFNYLLNPRHPSFGRLRIHEPDPFEIDKRLFSPGSRTSSRLRT